MVFFHGQLFKTRFTRRKAIQYETLIKPSKSQVRSLMPSRSALLLKRPVPADCAIEPTHSHFFSVNLMTATSRTTYLCKSATSLWLKKLVHQASDDQNLGHLDLVPTRYATNWRERILSRIGSRQPRFVPRSCQALGQRLS